MIIQILMGALILSLMLGGVTVFGMMIAFIMERMFYRTNDKCR